MKDSKVNISMLSGAKAAEERLAREEARELEASIPEGHLLHDNVERFKGIAGGDLSQLPAGHPLLLSMEAAKKRYAEVKSKEAEHAEHAEHAQETDTAQQKSGEIRKARSLEQARQKTAHRVAETDAQEQRKRLSSDINGAIDKVLGSLKTLYQTLAAGEKDLNVDPYCRMKVYRLKRVLFASERGVSECKLTRVA